MIPYTLNIEVRRQVTVILALISVCISVVLENSITQYLINIEFKSCFMNNLYSMKALELLAAVTIPPFIVWYLLHILYSKFLWKCSCFRLFHQVPNLNGTWDGYTFNDENPTWKRSVTVTIKQDWNRILVRTKMNDTNKERCAESFCECTVAAIEINSGGARLKYAYKNMLLGTESYVGYNELQIEEKKIVGQYITTKPTKGVFKIYKNE